VHERLVVKGKGSSSELVQQPKVRALVLEEQPKQVDIEALIQRIGYDTPRLSEEHMKLIDSAA
jgi:hypothetical protein